MGAQEAHAPLIGWLSVRTVLAFINCDASVIPLTSGIEFTRTSRMPTGSVYSYRTTFSASTAGAESYEPHSVNSLNTDHVPPTINVRVSMHPNVALDSSTEAARRLSIA